MSIQEWRHDWKRADAAENVVQCARCGARAGVRLELAEDYDDGEREGLRAVLVSLDGYPTVLPCNKPEPHLHICCECHEGYDCHYPDCDVERIEGELHGDCSPCLSCAREGSAEP